ncbi:hypothetical protein N7510_010166 [Penicillium lagena]|uniref:uncharacterized protein n=1 Tax=Penicillium lagena TaxID=94218 RepID=UPI00253F9285|nr:uncharacterized protein N7510_010166 [Penicillium lagena]KAJ5605012.1 hypothetical protein N7510_010166 [Penicillium lagena]
MASSVIPDSFLRGNPANASLRQIDFMATTPPIPAYKGYFAAIVDNFMTESECKEILRLAEVSTAPENPTSAATWEQAMVNAGNGRQVMSINTRKSGRIIWDSPEMASRLLDRLMPFLRECRIDEIDNQPHITGLGPAKRNEVYQVSGLNERMRFLRYEGGDYFRTHWDGSYVTPDGSQRSFYTIHLYLNGEGEQDMEELRPHIEAAEKKNGLFAQAGGSDLREIGDGAIGETGEGRDSSSAWNETLLGGATSFTDGFMAKDAVRVFPKTGSLLIFQQRNLFHAGDDVFRGVKYTVRTDIMYRKKEA